MEHATTLPSGRPAGTAGPETGSQGLPVSKLRGLTLPLRAALKRRGIATCGRLLRAAGDAGDRDRLAREAGIEPEVLLALVRRADLARIDGIGVVFGLMLEDLGVRDVSALAARDPADLHAGLAAHNREERLARRSPTPEEVGDWVARPALCRCWSATRAGGGEGEVAAGRPGAEAVVDHEVPRPRPAVELDDEHRLRIAQRVEGALAPPLEVEPEPLAVVLGLDRLEPVIKDVDPDQHAPASFSLLLGA